jgi:hypothetical protein
MAEAKISARVFARFLTGIAELDELGLQKSDGRKTLLTRFGSSRT